MANDGIDKDNTDEPENTDGAENADSTENTDGADAKGNGEPDITVSKGTAGDLDSAVGFGSADVSASEDADDDTADDDDQSDDDANDTDTETDFDSDDGYVEADDGLVTTSAALETEVPLELREDRPHPDDLPETGLVSEFVDVNRRQAAWLVSNRESSTLLRGPVFLVTAAVVVLGILAVLISAIVTEKQASSGTPSMAMVGIGEQAAQYEQQLGVKITDVKDPQAAEKLVRDGKVDAAFIQDPSGQGQPTIIALNTQPETLLEKLAPQTKATLLEEPAVEDSIATPLTWGLVIFSLLVLATLGSALYTNLRLEKRNRITEIIASTIDPRASASGRVTGLLTLVVIHLVVAVVVLELGLSISGKTDLAFNMLPGLGWFALALLLTSWIVFALLVWASTVTGDKARKTFVSIIGVVTVAGLVAPVFVGASGTLAQVLSWIPFTSPTGMAVRSFAGSTEAWEGLVAAAIALLVAVIVHSLAGGAYVRSVLAGGGRGGKAVKMSKRAQKVAAGSAASSDDADKSDSESADDEEKSDDDESDDDDKSDDDADADDASAKDSNDSSADESEDDSKDDKK